MVTFTLAIDGGMRATVTTDEPAHPDLLDEMSRRVVRMLVEANASLPGEVDDAQG